MRTGVTVVDPDADRNVFADPVTGPTYVLNGYGRSLGLTQVDELGEVETPIALTNTLDVWSVADVLVQYVLSRNRDARSVNPVVGECNDDWLNAIRRRHVEQAHVQTALETTTNPHSAEGCVGAGVGMTGFGWKAGIGTASRRVDEGTAGVPVLTNTGKPEDLRINGLPVNECCREDTEEVSAADSILMLVGTDAAHTARQLRRVPKRTSLGLG